ncbi:hypothetical protein RchiOBHm_Chr4g0430991 [Rosa chinensis]|uniref:Uncharacterized protein n=1 Tax=Rosa chinensis TaxID=74649 RepID=A0A2P6R0K5_ROSCH|nr:hypothetical protein RchiOBHm_Chr4g0430991 [Rosa chinensis]
MSSTTTPNSAAVTAASPAGASSLASSPAAGAPPAAATSPLTLPAGAAPPAGATPPSAATSPLTLSAGAAATSHLAPLAGAVSSNPNPTLTGLNLLRRNCVSYLRPIGIRMALGMYQFLSEYPLASAIVVALFLHHFLGSPSSFQVLLLAFSIFLVTLMRALLYLTLHLIFHHGL